MGGEVQGVNGEGLGIVRRRPPSSQADGCVLRFSVLRIWTNLRARAASFSATCDKDTKEGRGGVVQEEEDEKVQPPSACPRAAALTVCGLTVLRFAMRLLRWSISLRLAMLWRVTAGSSPVAAEAAPPAAAFAAASSAGGSHCVTFVAALK